MDDVATAYKKLKEAYPDDILLYQVGVFYRVMFEDARKVAGALGLQLRVTGDAAEPIALCGFPSAGLDKYVGRLLRAGFSAAICPQTRSESGEVRREVAEVIRAARPCSRT